MAQDRVLGHISQWDGLYPASVVLHNPVDRPGPYSITAYNAAGTSLGTVTGTLASKETSTNLARDFFGSTDVAYASVSSSTGVHVGVLYRRAGTTHASVYVVEARDSVQTWRIFPSTMKATWNGFAVVNLGRSTTDIVVHAFDTQGSIQNSRVVASALSPGHKALVVLDAASITAGGCEIAAQQPVCLVGFSGTEDHQVFTLMPASPAAGSTQTRILPHVTRTTSPVKTRILIGNSGETTQSYVLEGFDEGGRRVATVQDRISARTSLGVTPSDLFDRTDVGHIVVRADAAVFVFAAYHQEDSPAHFSAVPATPHQSRFWRLFPDRAPDIWDGFAVVNVGQRAADIWMRRNDDASAPTRIIENLPPMGKALFVIPPEPEASTSMDITSAQPLVLLSLRGHQGSNFVWSSPASPIVDLGVHRFDFQDGAAALQAGHTCVTPQHAYSAERGFGFTSDAGAGMDGSQHQWTIFNRRIGIEEAIPSAVLSEATVDCIRSSRRGTLEFRVDVPPGTYDTTVWVGDVTTPLHQIRLEVNETVSDIERADINTTRGQFWNDSFPFFGFSVPRTLRVVAPEGFVTCRLSGMPDSDRPIEWTYLQDEDPTQDPTTKTVVLTPAFRLAALQAMTLCPAADQPLVFQDGRLEIGDAPADTQLQDALDAFNSLDLEAALQGFEELQAPHLQAARAAGIFWVAGHPGTWRDEPQLLERAQTGLDVALALDPLNSALERLTLELDMARQAESYRQALGYAANGQSSSENLGRSCSLTEAFTTNQAYYRKGRILWLRNRGGLDPRRVTASWERAQWLAGQLDGTWGDINPFVRLYATDIWTNEDGPWRVNDWPNLIGEGPDWARALVSNLNIWIDLFEWWSIFRQSPEGDIGGGWSDDVEIMPAFGLMGLALRNTSQINEAAVLQFADGIWNSNTIDRTRGYQAQYADVEHTAEPTGNILHVVPMMRDGHPQGLERVMISAKTFSEFFLADATASPLAHRHFKGNHMSATQIALSQDHPDHRTDIPLNGRVTTPFPFLIWSTGNPGIAEPLRDWIDAWIGDAQRTDKNKPAGVFPNAVWCPPGFDEIGYPQTQDWFSAHTGFGQFTAFPSYQYYLYNLAGFFHIWTGDESYLSVHDTLRDLALMWDAHGRPSLPATPDADPQLWAGGKLGSLANGSMLNLKLATGESSWDAYLEKFGSSYGKFVLDPADTSPIDALAGPAETVIASWPYRTTEGVMTDRILVPGWADVISYYIGADVFSVFFGMPIYAVSWENTSRLFAAAVTQSSDNTLEATTFLFADHDRTVGIRFWHLTPGSDYVLEAGPCAGPGITPEAFDQSVAFTYADRGDGTSFTLPPRTPYGIRVRPIQQTSSSKTRAFTLKPDLGLSESDITWVEGAHQLDITVHNLGSETARDIVVVVFAGYSTESPVAAEARIAEIAAPIDLVPRTQTLRIDIEATHPPKDDEPVPNAYTVVLDPDNHIDESCERNNTAVFGFGSSIGPSMPPMITDIVEQPDSSPAAFTITGRNFLPDTMALVSGDREDGFEVHFMTDSELRLVIPAGAPPRTYLISLKNPDGQSSNWVPVVIGSD